jgi:hypothetical protein
VAWPGAIPPPRLYLLPSRDAPVAVVIRRGPSEWFHVLRWELETLTVHLGAWFHGTLYPRRSDVGQTPDPIEAPAWARELKHRLGARYDSVMRKVIGETDRKKIEAAFGLQASI